MTANNKIIKVLKRKKDPCYDVKQPSLAFVTFGCYLVKQILSTSGSGSAGADNEESNRDQEQDDTDIEIHNFCEHGFLLGYWCFEIIMEKTGLKTGIKPASNLTKKDKFADIHVNNA
jgi:hypothetical protein